MKKLHIKIIEILVMMLVTFTLLEIGLRIIEYIKYNSALVKQYREIYSDERDKPYLFSHKANINVKLENDIYNFKMITNSDGLREQEDYEYLPQSVIFLGDSIVEGASVENKETMSSIFSETSGIKALNFGVGSSNTVQEYFFLKEKYKSSYNTKLIILGLCLNDIDQNTYRRYFDPTYSNWNLYDYLGEDGEIIANEQSNYDKLKTIVKKLRTATVVNGILKKLKDINKPESTTNASIPTSNHTAITEQALDSDVSREGLEMTKIYIKKIADFAKENGSKFIVVIFPYESQLKINYANKKRAQDSLIKILNDTNIDYIDLYEPLKDAMKKSPDERWFHDNTHPYKPGHDFIGKYLAKKISINKNN